MTADGWPADGQHWADLFFFPWQPCKFFLCFVFLRFKFVYF